LTKLMLFFPQTMGIQNFNFTCFLLDPLAKDNIKLILTWQNFFLTKWTKIFAVHGQSNSNLHIFIY
jgi:hypothetical protein